ncbi:MAG: nuclear transport factor 2 family protein [Nonlabens sp.]|uniref:nuclear transport factor 2 family protein n=1 Tax=Nonlabens sp. TaxID=1888209 RepID=UPI00321A6FCF
MKKLQVLAILLFAITTISCANKEPKKLQQTDEEDIAAVEEVVQKLFDEVWAGYDENAITKYQTDDFLLLEHGEVWNNDTIANWCLKAQKRVSNTKRINNFERIGARVNGDKLWLAYHNTGTFKRDTLSYNRGWLESVVAVKQDSVWKLELMHSTRMPVE